MLDLGTSADSLAEIVMRFFKEIIIPQEIREVVDYITCDLCGLKIKSDHDCRLDYEENKVEIQWRRGSSHPEEGFGLLTTVDMCSTCFEKRLMPWLQSQGAQLRHVEYDY